MGSIMPCLAAIVAMIAQVEDEAHRQDRIVTQHLNEAALTRIRAAVRPQAPQPADDAREATANEADLKRREDQAIADWRRHQADCAAKDAKGC